ncbi:L-threonylcarbamoyladenylate synthase [Sandarakinorhabdus sp. DWP1-3-1]|uniref:L-threonylcarbamoyladenylate synthase n=1 Tax=Sandarakinorhabdus sp. DWP1-3-1 TaxID=2804627 RepID=UPI003CF2378A
MTDKSRIIAADPAGIAEAVALLDAGGIVAAPTETVYGLAARAADGAAVARIYAAKGRPSFNPLIVHVSGVAQAAKLVEIDPVSAALMAEFWPGALTLVLPLKPGAAVAGLVTAGLATLAVRCPAHPVMQALIAGAGPLAAPSANASGRISSTTAAHVAASLGDRVPLVLDGGACAAGVESTIVQVADGVVTLLRPGAVLLPGPIAEPPSPQGGGRVVAPGMMASHYAPLQPVRLDALTAAPAEFHIGFGTVAGDASLSPAGDLTEAAARLFDLLHVAEASGRAAIAVAPIPGHGLGLAINDRLNRAAAPK